MLLTLLARLMMDVLQMMILGTYAVRRLRLMLALTVATQEIWSTSWELEARVRLRPSRLPTPISESRNHNMEVTIELPGLGTTQKCLTKEAPILLLTRFTVSSPKILSLTLTTTEPTLPATALPPQKTREMLI
jgi:hypothetical protein